MVALAQDRPRKQRTGLMYGGRKAKAKIFGGSMIAIDVTEMVPASANVNLVVVGVATSAAGIGEDVLWERGCFHFANSTAADLITPADINKSCFVVDDQTVAKTNATNTRPVAGKIIDVDAAGVWVEF